MASHSRPVVDSPFKPYFVSPKPLCNNDSDCLKGLQRLASKFRFSLEQDAPKKGRGDHRVGP